MGFFLPGRPPRGGNPNRAVRISLGGGCTQEKKSHSGPKGQKWQNGRKHIGNPYCFTPFGEKMRFLARIGFFPPGKPPRGGNPNRAVRISLWGVVPRKKKNH